MLSDVSKDKQLYQKSEAVSADEDAASVKSSRRAVSSKKSSEDAGDKSSDSEISVKKKSKKA